MAELLVRARDNTHADPEVDRRGAWKRGDVVYVAPDGHGWGRLEGPPNFIVVRVPMTVAEAREKLAQPQIEDDDGNIPRDADGEPLGWRRRAVKLDIEALTQEQRDALDRGEKVALDEAKSTRASDAFIRKRDGAKVLR